MAERKQAVIYKEMIEARAFNAKTPPTLLAVGWSISRRVLEDGRNDNSPARECVDVSM